MDDLEHFHVILEGEKNFTITKEHMNKALENEPKIKKK